MMQGIHEKNHLKRRSHRLRRAWGCIIQVVLSGDQFLTSTKSLRHIDFTKKAKNMKSITLILILLTYTTIFSKGQITGVYSIERFDENLDCNIYFFKSGSYYIELSENVTSDIIESLVLSYGIISVTDNELTLIDQVHKYKIKLVVENNSLKVVQGFGFLLDKPFLYYNIITTSEPKFISSNTNSLHLQEERERFKKAHLTLALLNFGLFENEQGFKLKIGQDNKYKLEFKNIIISEGEWLRFDNELEFKDIYLNHSFYALINEKVIISKLLPGDYKGCSLFKK